MREHVRDFIAAAAECFPTRGAVYEFGSYQVEEQGAGADLRTLFPDRPYVGCDMRPGPGVDRVEDISRLSLDDDSAATIICVETLEHVFETRRAVDEMVRVLAPGGMVLISMPFHFRIHGYPDDYWRITPSCLTRLLEPLAATIIGSQGPEATPNTVYAVGFKAPAPASFVADAARFVEGFQARLDERRALAPHKRARRAWRWLFSTKAERRRVSKYYEARFAICGASIGAAASTRRQALGALT